MRDALHILSLECFLAHPVLHGLHGHLASGLGRVVEHEGDLFDGETFGLGEVKVDDDDVAYVDGNVDGVVFPSELGEGDGVDELVERVGGVLEGDIDAGLISC